MAFFNLIMTHPVLCLLFVFFTYTDSANILAVFPHVGKSHFFMFEPLIAEFANRGHHVTLISHFPPTRQNNNLQHINLTGSMKSIWFNALSLQELESMQGGIQAMTSLGILNTIGQEVCETGFSHPEVQRFIKSKPKIDLVIVEFFNNDCFAAFAHYFKAPLIGMFSSAMMPWHNDRFGNPDNPSYIPNHFLHFSETMTFSQRLVNTVSTYGLKMIYRYLFDPPAHAIAKKWLADENLPPLHKIVANSSLFFINSHFSLFQSRPLVPGIIELAGLHVKPAKRLPDYLEKYLNDSPNGVVYFSLGSTVLGSTMNENVRKALIGAFSKLSLNVLWKWENDTLPDIPKNVMIQKWFPQNDILAHPKVKVFVTHAGLMGVEEAVYHGVPMVLIPLFGDQHMDAAACVNRGVGVIVDYLTLTENDMLTALRKVLQDQSFTENARKLSKAFRDRPLPTMDSAIYWTEYVLKHEGAPYLRSAATKLLWYQEYLLDVFAVIFSVMFLILFITYKMVLSFLKMICCRRSTESNKKKLKRN